MIKLQRCADCGAAQYPPREFCGACLSDRAAWETADSLPGQVLACTTLHHSNEPAFRPRLPLKVGLVHLDAGPVLICFVMRAAAGDAVNVRVGPDDLLEAIG
ncbi:MAG TPA: zinc ribbon domain-containing protein [Acetobacteraceae bacterium]